MGVGASQLQTPFPRRPTQDPLPLTLPSYAYGAFTLYGPPFQASSASRARDWGESCNPTSPVGFPTRFGLPSAPFTRRYSGHRGCFLFLPVLRCFVSRGSRSLPRAPGYCPGRKSHSVIPGSTAACAYPGRFAACHDLRRRPSRAIPQLGSVLSTGREHYLCWHHLAREHDSPQHREPSRSPCLMSVGCGPGGTRTRDLRLAKPALYQLSYRPSEGPVTPGNGTQEVIEPQVPLRLPCYDLAPLAKPKFDPPRRSGPHLDPTRVA